MPTTLGVVIAERRLAVATNPDVDVRVRIGTPQPFPDPPADYYCPYQIAGIGDEKIKHAAGVDALQALEMALLIIPVELEVLARAHPSLRWEHASDAGDFGFSERLLAATTGPGWGEELRGE